MRTYDGDRVPGAGGDASQGGHLLGSLTELLCSSDTWATLSDSLDP